MTAVELIVNADDFGRTVGTNDGIIQAHERGIVTSASLMVRWPAASAAATYARLRPQLSVGLHFDMSEWAYRGGQWKLVYENLPAEQELGRQLNTFRQLVGRDPTHLDSHQHVHREEPVASLLAAVAADLGVPLRDRSAIAYCGGFYGQSGKGDTYPEGVTVDSLIALIEGLGPGVTELGCHPGLDPHLESSYRDERLIEVQTLCDLRVRVVLERCGILLRSFSSSLLDA